MPVLRVLIAAAVALMPAAGCGTMESPRLAAGAFRLESVAGRPVPVTLTGAVVIESESLTLEPNGVVIIETVVRNLTQGAPDARLTSRGTGSWSAKGERLTVTVPDRTMRLRIEQEGSRLRSEAISATGPGPDVYREYVYRREP